MKAIVYEGVTRFKKGDRVIVPFPVACGHCFFCRHGQYSQCDNSNPNGETGGLLGYSDALGGYAGGQAEYLRVPYANVGPVPVPEELSDEQVLFLTDILPTSRWAISSAGTSPTPWAWTMAAGDIPCSIKRRVTRLISGRPHSKFAPLKQKAS